MTDITDMWLHRQGPDPELKIEFSDGTDMTISVDHYNAIVQRIKDGPE
jgi:hypothetical protein